MLALVVLAASCCVGPEEGLTAFETALRADYDIESAGGLKATTKAVVEGRELHVGLLVVNTSSEPVAINSKPALGVMTLDSTGRPDRSLGPDGHLKDPLAVFFVVLKPGESYTYRFTVPARQIPSKVVVFLGSYTLPWEPYPAQPWSGVLKISTTVVKAPKAKETPLPHPP